MADQIRFSGEGDGVLIIEISDYERQLADNEDDANWLSSTITVQAGPLGGTFAAALTTHDLVVLYERLRAALQSLSGIVNFESTEEDISLEFSFSRRGSVSISGVAKPHASAAGVLQFRLETDQSLINVAVQQLSIAVLHFPVRQSQ